MDGGDASIYIAGIRLHVVRYAQQGAINRVTVTNAVVNAT